MTALLLFALFSIAFSFLCSVLEAVLLSVTPTYVQMKVQEGGKTGELLQKFKNEPNPPLTAILSLNTIAHTVGAILVGASTGAAFGEGTAFSIGSFAVTYEVIVSVVMTLAILVLSEIIPKNLGATNWKSWAPFTVRTLNLLVKFFTLTGFIWLSNKIKKLILRGDDPHSTALSRAEFLAVAAQQTATGELNEHEARILRNLLALETLTVHDVMTPRTVVVGVKDTMTIQEVYDACADKAFSRYPVFGETRDQVQGYIIKSQLFRAIIDKRGDESCQTLIRKMLIVAQETTLPQLIDRMEERHEPFALVVDEFGGMEGIVTMEDAMETLLGLEIMDEMDSTQDMQALARKRWRKRAKVMGLVLEEQTKADQSVNQRDAPE